MALKTYYLDKRTLKTPTIDGELANLQNTLDLKSYVEDIIAGQPLLVFPNGTAAAPGITFVGDTDTGIYLGGNNILDFSVAGSRVFDLRTNQVTVPAEVTFLTNTVNEITANAGVTIDGVLIKDGLVSNPAGTIIVGSFPIGGPQELSGAGAVNITRYNTRFTSTATGNALTLADATQVGQLKKIRYVAEAAGGDTGVLTPTTASGFTTITFNAIGDYAVLVWTPVGWVIMEYSGVTVA